MPLSDAQIERYSRQIVLPEIGGRGQERLLGAVVAVAGAGALAAIAGRYLAGAGIGTLRFEDAALGDAARRLNPEVAAGTGGVDATTTVVAAADLAPAALDAYARRARRLGVPLIAAGRLPGGGWLHVPVADADCAGCAVRAAAACGPQRAALPVAVATGVLGSLLALATLERILGLASDGPPLRWFADETSVLVPATWARAAACGAHAA